MSNNSIEVLLDDLPTKGLRLKSASACAIHRFPTTNPSNEIPPVAACAYFGDSGAPTSTEPADYFIENLELAARSTRFSLCSRPSCFGRVEPVLSEATTEEASPSKAQIK